MSRIFVHARGIPGVQAVEISDADQVSSLITKAKELGFQDNGPALVFAEDSVGPIAMTATLADAGLQDNASVHIGRCVRVPVTARYAGKPDIVRDFSPAQRIEHVFKWAIGKQGFDLTPQDALDFALQLCGQQGALNNDDHIGSLLTGDECNVCLDLVATDRIQG